MINPEVELAFINELQKHMLTVKDYSDFEVVGLFDQISKLIPMEPYINDHRLWTKYCEGVVDQLKINEMNKNDKQDSQLAEK